MPFIILIFLLIPLLIGFLLELITAWYTAKYSKWWKGLPFLLWLGLLCLVIAIRCHSWNSEEGLVAALLFVPGLPGLSSLIGLWTGLRLWQWLSRPKIVKDK